MTTMDPGTSHRNLSDVGVGQLVSDVTKDLSTLVRKELELAKLETKQEVSKAGKAGGALGGAALAAWLTQLFASLALMYALGELMHLGWAALIVAALWAIAAGILFVTGRSRMRQVNPVPERTVQTVKEDVQWMRNRDNSSET